MTRNLSAQPAALMQAERGRWRLQDAKASFSELLRMAHSEGTQWLAGALDQADV
jgi:hypothetical protein